MKKSGSHVGSGDASGVEPAGLPGLAPSEVAHARLLAGVYFAAVVLCAALLVMQLALGNSAEPFSNLFIPDGITLSNTFFGYWSGELNRDAIQGGMALNYIYYPALRIGVVGFLLVNGALILLASFLLKTTGRLAIAIVAIPYFILAAALPSKDIMMLLLSVAMIGAAVRRRTMLMVALVLAAYPVRDGGAVILAAFTALWIVVQWRRTWAPFFVAMTLVAAIAIELIAPWLLGDLFIYARGLDVQQAAGSLVASGSGMLGAAVRMFGNVTNLAFRPALLDEHGGLAVIGVIYFLSGIGLLSAFMSATVEIRAPRSPRALAAALLLYASLAVTTVNPFVQPRYLLPAAAVVLAVHGHEKGEAAVLKLWAIAALLACLGALAYMLSPIGLPAWVSVDGWWPYSVQ